MLEREKTRDRERDRERENGGRKEGDSKWMKTEDSYLSRQTVGKMEPRDRQASLNFPPCQHALAGQAFYSRNILSFSIKVSSVFYCML